MKKTLILGLMLTSMNAFAIETAQCPSQINATLAKPRTTYTVAQIYHKMGGAGYVDSEQYPALIKAVANMNATDSLARVYKLIRAKNGRCLYNANKKQEEKLEIYTQAGQNKLFAQYEVGPKGIVIRAYVDVLSLRPNRVELADSSASVMIGLPRHPYESYTAGGSLVFVGKGKLSLKSK